MSSRVQAKRDVMAGVPPHLLMTHQMNSQFTLEIFDFVSLEST